MQIVIPRDFTLNLGVEPPLLKQLFSSSIYNSRGANHDTAHFHAISGSSLKRGANRHTAQFHAILGVEPPLLKQLNSSTTCEQMTPSINMHFFRRFS